ncbi:transposase, partial [Escherichia coli]
LSTYSLPVAYYFRSSWQLQFLYLSGKIHRHKLPLKMWFYIFCHREYVINSS